MQKFNFTKQQKKIQFASFFSKRCVRRQSKQSSNQNFSTVIQQLSKNVAPLIIRITTAHIPELSEFKAEINWKLRKGVTMIACHIKES
jgi:hypothetical protein